MFYSVHAFWMIKVFRKIFPNGYVRSRDTFPQEEWEPSYKRGRVCLAMEKMEPAFAPTGVGSEKETPAVSVIDVLKMAAKRCGKEFALGQEYPTPPFEKGKTFSKPWNQWRRWTWSEYLAEVESTARAFCHLGLEEHGTVSIFGFNAPEWNISALAAMMCGAKACGIYPTDTV